MTPINCEVCGEPMTNHDTSGKYPVCPVPIAPKNRSTDLGDDGTEAGAVEAFKRLCPPVIWTPEWLIDRMKKLEDLPPPTPEQVLAQATASAQYRQSLTP